MDKDPWNKVRQSGAFVMIPFVMAVPPIVGWFIGRWLDRFFNISPVMMYILLAFGILGGIKECYNIITRFGENE